MEKITAKGNVVIVTKTADVPGVRGVYDAKKGQGVFEDQGG
jgi:hypothetical protein